METPSSYCQVVEQYPSEHVHRIYHDTAYGFPIEDDNLLFERLVLEINQAGLSWTTILNKRENFILAYHGFQINSVAAYQEKDRERLLADAGIIRNRLKIDAAIYNANQIIQLQQDYGSFKFWLDQHHSKTKEEWVKIFKQQFHFTGGEIVNEFLMSTGYLPGAHIPTCPIYAHVLKSKPAWDK